MSNPQAQQECKNCKYYEVCHTNMMYCAEHLPKIETTYTSSTNSIPPVKREEDTPTYEEMDEMLLKNHAETWGVDTPKGKTLSERWTEVDKWMNDEDNLENTLREIIYRNWKHGDEIGLYEEVKNYILSQKQQLENDYELKIPIYSKEIMEQARQDERMKTIRRMTAYKEGRQQLYKELREKIEGMKKETYETNKNMIYDQEEQGYNQALQDILSLLQDKE